MTIITLLLLVALLCTTRRLQRAEHKLERLRNESKPLSNGCIMVPSKLAKECIK